MINQVLQYNPISTRGLSTAQISWIQSICTSKGQIGAPGAEVTTAIQNFPAMRWWSDDLFGYDMYIHDSCWIFMVIIGFYASYSLSVENAADRVIWVSINWPVPGVAGEARGSHDAWCLDVSRAQKPRSFVAFWWAWYNMMSEKSVESYSQSFVAQICSNLTDSMKDLSAKALSAMALESPKENTSWLTKSTDRWQRTKRWLHQYCVFSPTYSNIRGAKSSCAKLKSPISSVAQGFRMHIDTSLIDVYTKVYTQCRILSFLNSTCSTCPTLNFHLGWTSVHGQRPRPQGCKLGHAVILSMPRSSLGFGMGSRKSDKCSKRICKEVP